MHMVKGVAWTVGIFGLSQSLRIVSSMILTRLLSPELFGIVIIVYTIQNGIELLSDVGFGQNIILNKNAEKRKFYDTVWTLRLLRGLLLLPCCVAAAAPIANLYHAPILAWILPFIGLYFAIASIASLSVPFLQRRMETAKLNIFQFIVEAIATLSQIVYAYLSPTVWALVFGSLVSAGANAIGSYLLAPDLRHKLYISKKYTKQIFSLGKWLFLSSTIFFLSYSFDNLYLGKVVPIELLGVYGIARTIAEAISALVGRISNMVIVPFFASHAGLPRADLRQQMKFIRATFLLVASFGFSILVTTADLLIGVMYDHRYQGAGWMLSVMLIGKWFSTLSSVNEATLIGFSKPSYGAYSFALKFVALLIGLPLAFAGYGIIGAILFVTVSEALRYIPLLIGQTREHFGFVGQDFAMTLLMLTLTGLWEWVRFVFGLVHSAI